MEGGRGGGGGGRVLELVGECVNGSHPVPSFVTWRQMLEPLFHFLLSPSPHSSYRCFPLSFSSSSALSLSLSLSLSLPLSRFSLSFINTYCDFCHSRCLCLPDNSHFPCYTHTHTHTHTHTRTYSTFFLCCFSFPLSPPPFVPPPPTCPLSPSLSL